MGKHNKINWTYEVIEADPLTEQELEEIAQILAEMIYEHMIAEEKQKLDPASNS